MGKLIALLGETEPAAAPAITAPATGNTSPQSEAPTPQALHKEMLWRLAALEIGMAKLSSRPRDIGDDNPPEPMEQEPLSESDREAITNAIAVLKTQPPEPSEPVVEALEAAQLLRAIGTRGRNAESPTASLGGSEFGKANQLRFGLADRMCALADAAIHWINSLGLLP